MTLYGSTGGYRNGLTGTQEWTRIDNVIRGLNGGYGMQLRRCYASSLPANFSSTESYSDVGKRVTSWTFTTPTWGTVANGSRNSDISDFCDTIPAGHYAYIGYFHEPEDQVEKQGWDAAEWVAAQVNLIQSVLAVGNPKVIPAISLMSWTGHPASPRNINLYDPGPDLTTAEQNATVMGQDGYATQPTYTPYGIFDGFTTSWRGLGWSRQAIWECGIQDFSTRTHWFNLLEQYANDRNLEVVTYFHSDTDPDPDTDCWLDLETYDPTALDTWAAIVANNQGADIPAPDPGDPPTEPPPPDPGPETRDSNVIYIYPNGSGLGSGSVGEDAQTETDTDWHVICRDFFHPNTVYARLTKFKEFSFTKTLNDVGFGELIISKADTFVDILIEEPEPDEEGQGILTYPLLFSFMQNGAERFRMIYDGKNKDRAKADAAEQIVLSGTGLAVALEWGITLPFGWPGNTKARARKNEDEEWANLFVSLFNEAQERNEIPDWLSLGFTRTHDSYGNPWETLGDREVECGSSLLDVITSCADSEEFDWIVTQQGVVHAAPILGADLTKKVRFFNAVNVNDTGNSEDRKDLRTVAYVEGTAGRISKVVSDVGTGRWGRRSMYVQADNASRERQRLRVGHGTLRQTRRPNRERTMRVPMQQLDPVTLESMGRTAFVDYAVGDLIGMGARISANTNLPLAQRDVRVQEMAVRVSADGGPEVELMLESRNERFEERVRRLLQLRFGQWSSAKAARLGKVPVANLRDTDAEFPNAGDVLVHDGVEFWKNGKAGIPLTFGYKGTLAAIADDDAMLWPCDGLRRLTRHTAQLRTASSSGPVRLRLKRNDSTVEDLLIPEGETKSRENISVPVTEDDNVSLLIIDPGTGAKNLQYVVETAV